MKNPVVPGLHEFGEIQFSLLYVYVGTWVVESYRVTVSLNTLKISTVAFVALMRIL